MNPNVDRLADEAYRKADPEYFSDEEEEEESEDFCDVDEFDIAREDRLIFEDK